jgi:hypothetical protein
MQYNYWIIDTDTIELFQIMQVTLFNEIVGQGEGCVSWVDISFDYSSIIFCAEGNIQLKHNVPWYYHQGNISSNHDVIADMG